MKGIIKLLTLCIVIVVTIIVSIEVMYEDNAYIFNYKKTTYLSILLIFLFWLKTKFEVHYLRISSISKLLNDDENLFLDGPFVIFKWIAKDNWPVEYVSKNVIDILGYSREYILSGEFNFSNIIHKDDLQRIYDEVSEYSSNENINSFEQYYRVIKSDNTIINIYDKTSIIRDKNREITHFYGYIIDVTDQKKIKDEVKDKTITLNDVEGVVELGYWSYDVINQKRYWSDGVYNIFGLKAQETPVTYKLFLSYIHPEDRDYVNSIHSTLLSDEDKHKVEHRIIVDGKVKYVMEYYKTYFKNGVPSRVLGIIIDITKRKEMESELLKVKNIESLGVVAGGLAHNLNNLLLIIQGNLDLIEFEEENKSNVAIINSAIQGAKELSNKMLIFAEGGDPVMKLSKDLPHILNEFIKELIYDKNIEFTLKSPPNDFYINVDIPLIKNAIENIITNSIEAFELNKIEGRKIILDMSVIELKTSENCSLLSEELKISIKDNAGGVSELNPEKIILPYFTNKGDKLGLGLTIAYRIIEKHNGEFSVNIEKHFGTEIVITLPILSANKNETKNLETKLESNCEEVIINDTQKILIMDDEELILKINKKFLEHKGYKVETALHGEEAIEKYRNAYKDNNKFSVVILDLMIPNGLGGEETAKKIIEIDKNSKLIASSGYSNSKVLSEYKNYGFINSLPKPYKLNELLEIIKLVNR